MGGGARYRDIHDTISCTHCDDIVCDDKVCHDIVCDVVYFSGFSKIALMTSYALSYIL